MKKTFRMISRSLKNLGTLLSVLFRLAFIGLAVYGAFRLATLFL